jgi:trimethylamine--corrinoid protein Co-methyltransferase
MIKLNIPRLELLSRNDLENIHNASLEVLERTGVVFKHEGALKVFEDAGAYVDYKTQKVYIPNNLIKEALKKAPSRVMWYARNPDKTIIFEDNRIHFGPVCTPTFVYDLEISVIL